MASSPETIGGSADLTGSNNTKTEQTPAITPDDFSGRYIHYGIREHGMAAAMNGMALHGGLIPYSGGFLIFTDYCRAAIRLSALMGIRVIHVLTHDSIGLGEDGPTHQPVEHLASAARHAQLHAVPAGRYDGNGRMLETGAGVTGSAIRHRTDPPKPAGACAKNTSRKTCAPMVPMISRRRATRTSPSSHRVREVEIALEARRRIEASGKTVRVVSVPCFELFEEQSEEYKRAIVGSSRVKIAIEAGVRQGWDRFIGNDGIFIGMSGFGASGPYKELYEHFGITADAAVAAVEAELDGQAGRAA